MLYGEAGSLLKYFQDKVVENPSFQYAIQMDCEEQIANIFWADAKMIVDYAHFGDVITFDTTFGTNKEYRPFGMFVGFNQFRATVVFGAALMYDCGLCSLVFFSKYRRLTVQVGDETW